MWFLKNFYRRYIKRSFFNKILFVYSIISICSILILTEVFLFNFSKTLEIREVNLNNKIINRLGEYMNQQYRTALTVYQSIYLDNRNISLRSISFFDLSEQQDREIQDEVKNNFDKQLANSFQLLDGDINDIVIKRYSDNTWFITENSAPMLMEPRQTPVDLAMDNNSLQKGFILLPAHTPGYFNRHKRTVYTMAARVMSADLSKALGEIYIEFNTDKIKNQYSEYADNLKGYILILNKSGNVLFDSSGKYYGEKYPYIEKLDSAARDVKLDVISIVNTVTPSDANVIVAGIIPKSEIYTVSSTIKQTVYLVSLVCILASLVMAYLSTSVSSRRAKTVTDAMKKLRSGDLSTRISIGKAEDELSEIAISFNHMCDDLQNYINKVYLSEIKQKNAQLHALQSQINPHFLYNMLEVIRMRAIKKEDEETGEMIRLLAALFRSTIRENMIIEVRDEIKFCNMYLELFKIKYGDRLASTIDVEERIMTCGILNHLLQPAVENYIVHGFDPDRNDNQISISGSMVGRDVILRITDNGQGIMPGKLAELKASIRQADSDNSIGLPNVNERIKLIYGDRYGLDITSEFGMGSCVTIMIQALGREELRKHVQNTDCR